VHESFRAYLNVVHQIHQDSEKISQTIHEAKDALSGTMNKQAEIIKHEDELV